MIFFSKEHLNSRLMSSLIFISFAKTPLKKEKLTKTEIAKSIGAEIAEKAIKKGIKTVVFDRGGFIYHGRIKALAVSAREKGLKF